MELRWELIKLNSGKKKRCKLAHWQSCSEPYFRLPSTLGCVVSRSPLRWSSYFFFGAGFFWFARLAYVPAANLFWNFSIRPAVSTNLSLPV